MSFYTDEQISMILSAYSAASWWANDYKNAHSLKERDYTWKWLGNICWKALSFRNVDELLKWIEENVLI